ncbi:MAG: RDD family protein [Bacilli bacterium]|nr:RDD family protein [Bacilli bacterium]MDD4282570.1 RDD family protein [Bacilli bacterium]MDD4718791.1 RDD family protein [Bacilli bacterium]
MASVSKRFLAYMIDVLLIGIIIFLFSKVLIDSNKIKHLNNQLKEVNEKILMDDVGFDDGVREYAILIKQIDRENVLVNVITIILILIYFVFIPKYKDGQTVGLRLLKMKIVTHNRNLLTISKLMLRNFILNGLAYLSICLTFLYLFSETIYFILVSILSFFQLGLVITSIFMILYRRDKRGLQDILSETKVINISGE